MAIMQHRANRKPSSGRYKSSFKKKLRYLGSLPIHTKLAAKVVKTARKTGGRLKTLLSSVDVANVYDPKTKKYEKLKIETVVENKANRHFVRRNIMTKGSVIKTAKGNAIITSSPGQVGTVNAVLV